MATLSKERIEEITENVIVRAIQHGLMETEIVLWKTIIATGIQAGIEEAKEDSTNKDTMTNTEATVFKERDK